MNVLRAKNRLLNRISKRIDRMCTNDCNSCMISFCKNGVCNKGNLVNEHMTFEEVHKVYQINNIDWNNYLSSIKPFIDSSILNKCEYILGEPIYEHDLIKGKKKYIDRINRCQDLKQVIVVMNQAHFEKNGYRLKFKK